MSSAGGLTGGGPNSSSCTRCARTWAPAMPTMAAWFKRRTAPARCAEERCGRVLHGRPLRRHKLAAMLQTCAYKTCPQAKLSCETAYSTHCGKCCAWPGVAASTQICLRHVHFQMELRLGCPWQVGVALSKNLMAIAGESLKANITTLGPLVLPVSEQLLFFMNLIGRKVCGCCAVSCCAVLCAG